MTEDQVKQIIQKYAQESYKQVAMKVLDLEQLEPRQSSAPSSYMAVGLNRTLIREIVFTYMFDSLALITIDGLNLPLNNFVVRNEFLIYDDRIFINEERRIVIDVFAEPRSRAEVLLCNHDELVFYMADESQVVRKLAEMRWNWKYK